MRAGQGVVCERLCHQLDTADLWEMLAVWSGEWADADMQARALWQLRRLEERGCAAGGGVWEAEQQRAAVQALCGDEEIMSLLERLDLDTRHTPALGLGDAGADCGNEGLEMQALLLESLGRFDEALELYQQLEQHGSGVGDGLEGGLQHLQKLVEAKAAANAACF